MHIPKTCSVCLSSCSVESSGNTSFWYLPMWTNTIETFLKITLTFWLTLMVRPPYLSI
jgi:hypothetical protein